MEYKGLTAVAPSYFIIEITEEIMTVTVYDESRNIIESFEIKNR